MSNQRICVASGEHKMLNYSFVHDIIYLLCRIICNRINQRKKKRTYHNKFSEKLVYVMRKP
jgi:hypothetical protein